LAHVWVQVFVSSWMGVQASAAISDVLGPCAVKGTCDAHVVESTEMSCVVPSESGAQIPRLNTLGAESQPLNTLVAASWESLVAFAASPLTTITEGRGPRRSGEVDTRYRRYMAWLNSREQTPSEYLAATGQWREVPGGPTVALEPNIAPFELEAGIEQWNLWYNSMDIVDLDIQPGCQVMFLDDAPTSAKVIAYQPDAKCQILSANGSMLCVDLRSLFGSGDWTAVWEHLRFMLPSLQNDEAIVFQNPRQLRLAPDLPFANVFIRANCKATRNDLHAHRLRWRDQSPWAEHERLLGRGNEVGYDWSVPIFEQKL